MKRFLLVIAVLILAGATVYAQQGTPPTSAQITQSAQQFLTQGRSNLSHFESVLAQLIAANISNDDANTFNRIRSEIERLENLINTEETRVMDVINAGNKVTPALLDRVERLIDQHRAKLAELEAFVAR